MTMKLTAEEPSAVYKVLRELQHHTARLGDVLTVIRGVTYKKEQARQTPSAGLVPLLRATNIQQSLNFDDLVYVPASCVSEMQTLRRGDIVVAASSGSRNIVGKAAPLTRAWVGSFGAFCFALRPKPGVHAEYLAWFMHSPQYRERVSVLAAGVNINNLRASHIEETVVPLPSVEQQREVVTYLDEQLSRLDASVAALLRAQANLKRYRASVLKAACEGRLVPTEAELARAEGRTFETGAQLLQRMLSERRTRLPTRGKYKEPIPVESSFLPNPPEGWTWASVDEIASSEPNSITDGPFGSNLKSEHYTASGPRVVRLQNIKDGEFADEYAHIDEERFLRLAKHRVFAGDLVIATLGDAPPRACMIPANLGPAIVKADCVRFKSHDDVLPAFANLVINAQPTRKRVKGLLHGVGRPRLALGELRTVALPLPPLAEQHRIVAEADRRLSLIRGAEAQVGANLARAKRLRQSILQAAFAPA